jgi:hypothetical protein
MIAICIGVNHGPDASQPSLKPVVVGETDAGALVVARRIDSQPAPERDAVFDRHHQDVGPLWHVDRDQVGDANI